MVLYCFQEFLLLALAFPGTFTLRLKAEIKEEPRNRVIARTEVQSMEGRWLSSSGE